jgi:hypothetical protein
MLWCRRGAFAQLALSAILAIMVGGLGARDQDEAGGLKLLKVAPPQLVGCDAKANASGPRRRSQGGTVFAQ